MKEKKKEKLLDHNTPTIIQTDVGSHNGQNKCPNCGSTDISLNIKSGHLQCNFCRFELESEKVSGLETDLSRLEGQIIGSGATDMIVDTNDIITLKCSSCGAEVVIDTKEAVQARCHWCRNTLSINQQIPNGSIPDAILPFGMTKEDARSQIENFVGKRKFFAHPKFKEEFTTENIMGVYFPYMVVDVNSHANFIGQGEHLVRQYTVGDKENRRTYYDADLYDIEREFDLQIEGLTIESSADRLNNQVSDKTNNIINSIMPFDVENCVKWDANYLKGYTSEKRDMNIEDVHSLIEQQAKDIARFSINETLTYYNRGVKWSNEEFNVKGEQWKAAYLPVWLYSYLQKDKNILHYVAVNARTKETMGSVPIHTPKLLFFSMLIEILGIIAMMLIDFDYNWLFLLVGFIYFFVIHEKYRNKDARHKHEIETKTKRTDIKKVDKLVRRKTGLSNSKMEGANHLRVNGKH